jgi:hypothetical protein
MASVLKGMRGLATRIKDANVADEHVWFKNLLLGILNSALLDYGYVGIAAKQESPYLAAWSCRCLLELKVITTYVLASAKNAADFKDDFLIDMKEFWGALTDRHKATHAQLVATLSDLVEESDKQMKKVLESALQREVEQGPRTAATSAETEMYKQLMNEFGVKENAKPKQSGEIARSISQHEQFKPMFKVCSKIMHRTALSIASSVSGGSLNAILPLLRDSAASELLSIRDGISKYFGERGVQPPTN